MASSHPDNILGAQNPRTRPALAQLVLAATSAALRHSGTRMVTMTTRRSSGSSLCLERLDDYLGLALARTSHFVLDPVSDLLGGIEADQAVAVSPSPLGRHRARHGQATVREQRRISKIVDD
jgi:hypothetical protein